MNWTTRLIAHSAMCAVVVVSTPELRAQGVRELAPGVLRVIPSEPNEEETFLGPIELSALTQFNWTPNFAPPTGTLKAKASQVTLRHNVWNLEFAFKPLRMVHVDIPQPTGRMQRKLIWYMVYRVRNLGGHLTPVPVEDEHQLKTYTAQRVDEVMNVGAAQPTASIRFFPHFVLESRQVKKAYLDVIVPVAIPVIELREMRGAKLFNSVEISRVPIQVSKSEDENAVWGVVTWMDVDPNIDFASVFIQGLTNAFRTDRTPDGQAVYRMKTLQLNFWRPGDSVYEHEGEIRYGIRAVANPEEQSQILTHYGIDKRLDHLWIYR
ncbi:MAG: hypothetical protein KJ000_08765 [Pirellulaceae bacterium]|nr:hypothetical protein [Pirellulaceae bacterium]